MMQRAPQVPEQFTPDWFTAALAKTDLLRGRQVTGVEWARVGEEFGFTGMVVRAELTLSGKSGGCLPVIVKLPFAHGDELSGYQAAHQSDEAYVERCVREVRFYREIRGDPAPRAYFAAGDESQRQAVIVLEDLSCGRSGDVLLGCSPGDAVCVLDRLAAFHGRHWGDRAPASWQRWDNDRDGAARQERFAAQAQVFLERRGASFSHEFRVQITGLRSRLAEVFESLAARPRTLIHGDLHLDNVVFDVADGRACVVLDWQSVCVGPPALDLARFVIGSLSVSDRRSHEAALLARYVEELRRADVHNYGVSELLRDYRLALALLLAGTIGWIVALDRSSLTGRERNVQDAALGDGKLVAALEDHGEGIGAALRLPLSSG